MKHTRWILLWALVIIIFGTGVGIVNYYVDPYGLRSYENKYMSDISSNTDTKINLKLSNEADYYLIGTSRLIRIDPNIPENLLKKRVYNIGISAASFKENLLLARKVKHINKNFIFGLDVFSLNQSSHNNDHYENRMHNLVNGLEKSSISSYFSSQYLVDSFRVLTKYMRGKALDENYQIENQLLYDNTLREVYEEKGFSDHEGSKGAFTNYKIYDDKYMIQLAKLADKKDIFIIYPQHYYYYILFHRYQGIEEQYQRALRILVENTKAKVWTFYMFSDMTKDFHNFDGYGWHFKPKLADDIFSNVFTKTKHSIGMELNKKNLDKYFKYLKSHIDKEEKLSEKSLHGLE